MIPGAMVKCNGCGFNVEQSQVVDLSTLDETHCERCTKCQAIPDLRESYRRGFNAGLDAMAEAVTHVAKYSALRKPAQV